MTSAKPEEFKYVTAVTLRTIAGKKDLESSFAAGEPPTGRITSADAPRLPAPDIDMNAKSVRLVRGCADAHALHIAHHNPKMHYQNSPKNHEAASAFMALEQARCEALGFKEMMGVGANLNAVLEEKCKRAGFANLSDREQAPLGDALHVLARVNLTGESVPPAAKKLVELWQPWLDERLKALGFSDLKSVVEDQEAYSALSRQLIEALDMDTTPSDDEVEEDGLDAQNDESAEDRPQDEEQSPEDSPPEDGMPDMDSMDDSEDENGEQQEQDGSQSYEDDALSDGAGEIGDHYPQNRPDGFTSGPGGQYLVYTTQFDEEVAAQDLAEPEELTRLRAMLDKQLLHNQTIITKLANRLQRKVMARQQRSWQFDLEEGVLDPAYYYAPLTHEDNQGRRIMHSWIREGRSVDTQVQAGWSGVQAIPRVLRLDSKNRLIMTPVEELHAIRGTHHSITQDDLDDTLVPVQGMHLEIHASFDPSQADNCGITVAHRINRGPH